MGQADRAVRGEPVGDDEPAPLDGRQRLGAGQLHDLAQRQRLGEREQLQRSPLVAGDALEPRTDQFGQRRARRWLPHQAPEPAAILQRAVCQGAGQQLADVQEVPAAAVERPTANPFLGGRRECRLDDLGCLCFVERAEVQELEPGVLPEGIHRVRPGLSVADGGEHERDSGQRDVEYQRGGRGVEQLRVVDPGHDGPVPGCVAQRRGGGAHQPERVLGLRVARDDPRAGAEWDGCRAARRLDPGDVGAVALRGVHGEPREP